jgi:hypothetical protein
MAAMPSARSLFLPTAATVLLVVAGCGSSKSHGSTAASSGGSGGSAAGSGGAGALSAEAQSKATGDIPDNQVFLTYKDTGAGYSIQVPEGWARKGSGSDVTFQNMNNIVHIVIAKGALPSAAAAGAELRASSKSASSLKVGATQSLTVSGAPALKLSYSTTSPPNPVTGKRVQLLVDRYLYAKGGKRATIDLATAKGVDNVDAYKMMSRSFKWQ